MTRPTLIGREREIEAIGVWADDGVERVMTLRGPGGAGKTTLAREFEHSRGWTFVALEPCRDADDVFSAVASAIGVAADLEQVRRELAGRDVVVLDNAEHVVDEVRRLIRDCGEGCRFLVTSRVRIGGVSELVWDVGTLTNEAARELFVRRAQASSPRFREHPPGEEEIDRLVERVDRLPLALELAAARTELMSPEQITERLDRQFDILRDEHEETPRHATMDACVEWSWALLGDAQRDVLRQCAVFRSTFDLEDAERVVETDGWSGDVIQSLVEQSLLRSDGAKSPRFALFDAVRRFIDRREPVDDAVVLRLLKHLASEPGRADPWNLLNAIELGITVDASAAAMLLVRARPSFVAGGFVRQLPRLFELVTAQELSDDILARVLVSRAAVGEALGEGPVEQWLSRAEQLAEADETWSPRVRLMVASLRAHRAIRAGNYERAEQQYALAQGELEALDDATTEERVRIVAGRGFNMLRRGDIDRASESLDRAYEIAVARDDAVLRARCLSWRGLGELAAGRGREAAVTLRQSVELLRATGDVVTLAHAQHGLAVTLLDDDPEKALEVARQAEASSIASQRTELTIAVASVIALLEGGPHAADTLRSLVRRAKGSDDHQDLMGVWLALVVVLVRDGELQRAIAELELLNAHLAGRTSVKEGRWLDQYGVVVHALVGGSERADGEFGEAVRRVLAGEASEDDLAAFDDPHMRLMFEGCPAPLRLLAERVREREEGKVLTLLDGGMKVTLPSGREVSFERRHLLRRLFSRVCETHKNEDSPYVTSDELIEAGWPDEKMTYESAQGRLYSAIRNLRKLGLEEILITTEGGYAVDPNIEIRRG